MNDPNMQETEILEEKKKPIPDHPVDKGWAWIICFGAFMSNAMVGGFARTTGMFFIEICDLYQAEKSDVAWIFSLFYLISYLSAPLGILFSTKLSCRISMIIAAGCSSGGLLICSYAPNYVTFFFSYSFLLGCFQGITMVTLLTILNEYFDKKNSLAMGIMLSGGSFGGLTIPALIQIIINQMGFQNMLMLLSAVYLHGLVIASLFRSPSFYRKRRPYVEENIPLNQMILEQESQLPLENTCSNKLLSNINWQLLKNPSLYFIILTYLFQNICYVATFFLIPTYAKELGFTKNHRIFLLFIMGFPDLISRILAGYLADLKNAPQKTMFIVSMVMLALSFSAVTFIGTYSSMVAFVIISAFFNGAAWTLTPVICRMTLGAKNFPVATGLTLAVIGPVLLSCAPILTLISDQFGSWAWSYRYITMIILLSCGAMTLVPVSEYFKKRRRPSVSD